MRSGRWATKGRHAGNARHPGDTVKLITAELEHTCPTSQPQQTRSQPRKERSAPTITNRTCTQFRCWAGAGEHARDQAPGSPQMKS